MGLGWCRRTSVNEFYLWKWWAIGRIIYRRLEKHRRFNYFRSIVWKSKLFVALRKNFCYKSGEMFKIIFIEFKKTFSFDSNDSECTFGSPTTATKWIVIGFCHNAAIHWGDWLEISQLNDFRTCTLHHSTLTHLPELANN